MNNQTKMRFEEMLESEDVTSCAPSNETKEAIQFIMNTMGRDNFAEKLENAKGLIGANNVVLKWFIYQILIRRVSQQVVSTIYIDLLKGFGIKECIPLTINLSFEILRKCLAIDEEKMGQVVQSAQGQHNILRHYLMNLGTFIGCITIASNRPILTKEFDLKQLLIESIEQQKVRLVVPFVSKILKESIKSTVFTVRNPFVHGLLQFLKEIYDNQPQAGANEIMMEIDSLCKALGVNIYELQPTTFIKFMT